MALIQDAARLRQLIGDPNQAVALKMRDHLNARAIDFIGRAPLAFLATADANGQPTVSPKGDGPGFVRVADASTLLIPERKGNKLIVSLQNVLANPAVGLIFLVPPTGETLRVHGHAELTDDPDLCESFTERGQKALLVMRVRVTQVYFHCAKAFLRSRVWQPETWPAPVTVSFGAEIAEAGGLAAGEVEGFDQAVAGRYRTDL